MREPEIFYVIGGVTGGLCTAFGALTAEHYPTVGAFVGMTIFLALTPIGFAVMRRLSS